MIKFCLAITSLLCIASASAAAFDEDIQNYTEKTVTETDLPKEFNDLTTILPDLPHVNSCAYPGTCPSLIYSRNCQICQNGYVKDPEDDTKCKYGKKDKNAFLIVSESNDIKTISIDRKHPFQKKGTQTGDFAFSRHIDYNFKTNTIFWYSKSDKTIYTAPLSSVDSDKQSIMQNDSYFIAGIAVDWIYNHIYWVDRELNEICVSNFNGTMKKVLLSDGFTKPLSIVVNPLSGWMYWTVSMPGRIERAGLDGSQREVVLGTELYSPYGLALDLVANRLYWSQERDFRSIWSSNFDGSDRKLVFKEPTSQSPGDDFRKIGIFDKYLYLMNWGSNVIYKVNKCNGQELETVYNSTLRIWDFKMYHSTLQPEGENLCLKRSQRCSHLCLPAPSSDNEDFVSTTTCACPDGLYLSSDQRSCVSQI